VAKAADQSIRPVLIVSNTTIARYGLHLQRLLVGLADQSVAAVLIAPPDVDLTPLVCGPVHIVQHPVIDVPFAEHLNRGRLLGQLLTHRPTVIHSLCETKAALARQLARQLDIPYVVSINTIQRRVSGLSFSSRRCARVICSSQHIAHSIRISHPRIADRVEVVPPGTFVTDTPCCFASPATMAYLVAAYPLQNVTDFDCVFRALHDLVRENYELTMILMGQGHMESAIRQHLSLLDLTQVVTLVPDMKPWRAIFSAGDIYILPKPTPWFNAALLEAMSVGMAVAACYGGVDDMIKEGQTAAVFDASDNLSVRATIQRLMDRREYARQLGRGAQTYLRGHHSVDHMVTAYIRVYRQVRQWSYGLATIA